MTSRAVAVSVALLLVFAGCAGTDVPGGPTATQSSPVPSAATPPDSTETDARPPTGSLSVHYIAVGQASSTLVVGPTGETMLIDTGDFTDDGEFVLSYLRRIGVDRIDYLVTSHADADHIGGHEAVIEYFETERDGIGAVYDPGIAASTATYEEYLDAVERHDVTLYRTQAGDEIPMAGVEIDVLAPPEGYLADRDRNENSLVLHTAFGETSFLFPGDAASAGEEYLVDEHADTLDATVLQAGHHGAADSTGAVLLDAVDPRVAVISSAYDSQYGHPHDETLRRLADRSIRTYWTAVHGDVVLESDGDAVTVSTQRDVTTNSLELRDAEPIEPGATDPVERRIRLDLGDGGTAAPTATRTPTATDGGRPDEALAIAEINADAPGDDGDNLDEEYVVFENRGEAAIDLSGWTVSDEADHEYAFPDGFVLQSGATVTLRTGSGTDDATDLYWGAERPIWNNDGDTVVVRDASDEVVIEREYEG